MLRRVVTTAGAVGLFVALAAPPATAAPRTQGGCQQFGAGNVAVLAQTLGGGFGAQASFVASQLGPRAFPTFVVFPEQSQACG